MAQLKYVLIVSWERSIINDCRAHPLPKFNLNFFKKLCVCIQNMASRHIQRAHELSQDGFESCADEHIKHAVQLQQQFAHQSFGAALRFKYTDLEPGDVIVFSNVDEQGKPKNEAIHNVFPVREGQKLIFQIWAKVRPRCHGEAIPPVKKEKVRVTRASNQKGDGLHELQKLALETLTIPKLHKNAISGVLLNELQRFEACIDASAIPDAHEKYPRYSECLKRNRVLTKTAYEQHRTDKDDQAAIHARTEENQEKEKKRYRAEPYLGGYDPDNPQTTVPTNNEAARWIALQNRVLHEISQVIWSEMGEKYDLGWAKKCNMRLVFNDGGFVFVGQDRKAALWPHHDVSKLNEDGTEVDLDDFIEHNSQEFADSKKSLSEHDGRVLREITIILKLHEGPQKGGDIEFRNVESPTDSPGELRMDYDNLSSIKIVRSETAPESKYTDIRSKRFIGEDGVHYDWKYFIYEIDGVKIVTENMARFLSKSKNHTDLVMALHGSTKRSWLLTQLREYAKMHKKGKFMKKLDDKVENLSTLTQDSNALSLTTYNILLDGFEEDMEDIDGHRKRVLKWSTRLPFVVNTLKQRQSAILCMQETNASMADQILSMLSRIGMQYKILLGITGRSGKAHMQCAVMYDSSQFVAEEFDVVWKTKKIRTNLFEPEYIYQGMRAWRMVVCKLRHRSGKTLCVASIHLAAGEEKDTEEFRETQVENLLQFSEQIQADCHLICGDFNSDPLLSLSEGDRHYKLTKVAELLTKRNYLNISGNLKTYHGWTQATFDFVYAKTKIGTSLTDHSAHVNPKASINIPSTALKEGSDHAALTVNFKLDSSPVEDSQESPISKPRRRLKRKREAGAEYGFYKEFGTTSTPF